jgi:hypothetical protein
MQDASPTHTPSVSRPVVPEPEPEFQIENYRLKIPSTQPLFLIAVYGLRIADFVSPGRSGLFPFLVESSEDALGEIEGSGARTLKHILMIQQPTRDRSCCVAKLVSF